MLRQIVESSGPIDLFRLAAQGVQIGDDVHMRTQGTTSLLIRNLLPQIAGLRDDGRVALAEFLSANHLFFLNLAIAAAKSAALWAELASGTRRGTAIPRAVLSDLSAGVRSAAERSAKQLWQSTGLPEPWWNAEVRDSQDRLCALAQMTIAIRPVPTDRPVLANSAVAIRLASGNVIPKQSAGTNITPKQISPCPS